MNKTKNKNLITAFTLIEIIIYLAVFSVFFVGVINVLIVVNKNSTSESRKRDLTNVVNYLNQHIQESFNQSQEIETPQYLSFSNPGSTSTLKLANILQGSLLSNPNRINYFLEYDYLANKQITFYTGNGNITPTMAPKNVTDINSVTIVSVNFYPLPPTKQSVGTNPSGVKAVIILQSVLDSTLQVTLQNVYLI